MSKYKPLGLYLSKAKSETEYLEYQEINILRSQNMPLQLKTGGVCHKAILIKIS